MALRVGLAAWALLAASVPAQATVRGGIPQPRAIWWWGEEGEAEPAAGSAPFSSLTATRPQVEDAGAGSEPEPACPTTMTLNPDISSGLGPRPLVDTASSFSAAAWVRLEADAAQGVEQAVAVAQGGDEACAFALGYVSGYYAFTTALADSVHAPVRHHWAAVRPQLGAWTHLVGVYDARGGQLRLYVEGELAASAPAPKMWRAERATTIGRGLVDGKLSPPWPGDIEDVRVFATALTDANVRALYRDQPQL